MSFVQGEEHGVAVLLQPVRQPEHRIVPSLRADLERDAGYAGLQVDGEIVEDSGRSPDRTAYALHQHFRRRQVFGEEANLDNGVGSALLLDLIGQPLEKHGLAVAPGSVEVGQTEVRFAGVKPVHDVDQWTLDRRTVAHVAGPPSGTWPEGIHRHRVRHGSGIIPARGFGRKRFGGRLRGSPAHVVLLGALANRQKVRCMTRANRLRLSCSGTARSHVCTPVTQSEASESPVLDSFDRPPLARRDDSRGRVVNEAAPCAQ